MFRRATPLVAAVFVASLAACGGTGTGAFAPIAMTACDWIAVETPTAVAAARSCKLSAGATADIAAARATCSASTPAGVVRDTCPATGGTGLVGCCSASVGHLRVSWCYYDAELYPASVLSYACRNTIGDDGDPAVWTTTVPNPRLP